MIDLDYNAAEDVWEVPNLPAWVTEALAAIERRNVTEVSLSRYPHTYAYDFIREHAAIFKVPYNFSRADVAGWLEMVLGVDSRHKDHLKVVRTIADTAIRMQGLSWPQGWSSDLAIESRCEFLPDGSLYWKK